jgi:RNA polymerase sigma factor (sigma-70 family)
LQAADAEDVTQKVLERLFTTFRAYDFDYDPGRGRFRGFLYAVVHNAIRDLLRRVRGRPGTEELLESIPARGKASGDPAEGLEDWDERQHRHALLEQAILAVRQRVSPLAWAAFCAVDLGGRTSKEVAEALGMTVAALHQQRHRLRQQLREEIAALEESVRPEPTPEPSSPRLEAVPPSLPHIPGYETLRILGRGGVGFVYAARQLHPQRLVALKLLREDLPPLALERFREEADFLAELQHPNIVPLYDRGEHAGRHYYTMQFAEGGSLRQQLQRFVGAERDTARLLAAVAGAADYLHQRGIVHGDLKPGNILLLADDTPLICDFGVARRIFSEGARAQPVAPPGGTPAYMAPELFANQPGPASDVYTLGITLYQLLTGKLPFTEQEWAVRRPQDDRPVPPREIRPGGSATEKLLLERLEAICLRCLEPEPVKRPSAADLACELAQFARSN